MQPLVSVIVPVYNVEAFVEKSVMSIMTQTYQNLEIIIVNDGSTDKSFEICKKMAGKDHRIILLEQENQGLSAARNTGIKVAKGEYLMFVDSDDRVANHMVELLYSEIKKHRVKLAMCSFLKVFDDNVTHKSTSGKTEILESETAIRRMLLGEWWSAWAKLYHKSIFKVLRFPSGRTMEDYAIMVQIFEQCDKIIFNHSKLYYYLTRPHSITTKPLNERNFDEVVITEQVLQYVEANHPKLYQPAQRNLGASLIKLIFKTYQDKTHTFDAKLDWLLGTLDVHYKSLLQNPHLPFKQKIIVRIITHLNNNGKRRFANWYRSYYTTFRQ